MPDPDDVRPPGSAGPRRNAGTITAEHLYVEMIELRKAIVGFNARFDVLLQMLPQLFAGAAQTNQLDPNAVMQMLQETFGIIGGGPRRRR